MQIAQIFIHSWMDKETVAYPYNWMLVCLLNCSSCVRLYDSMDWSLTGSSDCGISQARILEWVAMPSSRGSSRPRDRTQGSNPGLLHCRQWSPYNGIVPTNEEKHIVDICTNWMNIKIIIRNETNQMKSESTLSDIIYIKFYKMQTNLQ